ncbi:hypothetical protein COCVIDRAFT_32086 [Bipolaris victoriae FI3]|uniref:Uncharacterized protein n=1 Tax=Bipolaris victoriae (strain FI3) TaxID=930091 RepID=W7DWW6_BIPV3|nr:hypothetical protein COCVIDRAFT_32086 [Bipolaris victoriae FI3]
MAEIAERLESRLTIAEYWQAAVRIGWEVVGERFAAGYSKQLDGRAAGASGNKDVSSDEDEDREDLLELLLNTATAVVAGNVAAGNAVAGNVAASSKKS